MQSQTPSHPSRRRACTASLLLAFLFLAVAALRPAAPALAACGGTTVVTTEAELNAAIADFNGQAGPCAYEIEFGAGITLTSHLTTIQNANTGVSILIDGAGFTLDGVDQFNTIDVLNTEVSTVDNLTIVNSINEGVDGSGTDMRLSRVTVSGSNADGVEFNNGNLVVVNSTIASNSDEGIDAFDVGGSLRVINTTVTDNSGSGILFINGFATLTHVTSVNNTTGVVTDISDMIINNSILADNDTDCALYVGSIDVNSSLVEVDDPSFPCGVTNGLDGNIVGVDPQLGVLADNGGPTQTHLPGASSDAIDAGSNELADDENIDPLFTDQRGFALRIVNGTADMGAVEVGAAELVCSVTMTAGDEAELIKAILCFNLATTPGSYEIVFEADITQTGDLTVIENATAGISLLIDGAGFTLDGDAQHDLINIQQSDLTIDRLTVIRAANDAVAAFNGSSLRVSRSSITNNGSDGIDSDAGSLVVTDSTIAFNGNDGVEVTGTTGPHVIINSTISSNATRGAVTLSGETDLLLTQVTVYANGSSGVQGADGQITVHNSIVAGNHSDCSPGGGTGTIVFDHSLVEDAANACGATDGVDGNIVGADPLLGALGDFGGPTHTHPPLVVTGGAGQTSPVIDAGDNDLAIDEAGDPLEFDQRGMDFSRVVNGTVDMGAFEGAETVVCGGTLVSTEAELNNAIDDFNSRTDPGAYEIEFCADITLTADLTVIQNATSGLTLLIDGAGFTLDGDDQHDLINIQQSYVTIDRLTVTRANDDAIATFNGSNLRVSRSTLVNNGSDGIDTDGGSLVLRDSTIAFNGNDGLDLTATVGPNIIINTTISQNTTRGVVAFSTTNVQLTQVTIYDNQTGVVNSDGHMIIHNSIVAGNQSDCQPGGGTGIIVFDHSLIEDAATTCVVSDGVDGNIVGADPLLGALGPNGGPTDTHLPDDNSDAVDAGDNDLADDENGDSLAADQRGFVPRVVNGTVDMGAVEVGAEDPEEPVETTIFMSTTAAGTTGDGLPFGPHDILEWDGSAWSTYFDGTAAGLTPNGKAAHNINAFALPHPDGSNDVYIAFAQNARAVPGIPGKVDGTDLVVWTGASFLLAFDGSDVGLAVKSQEKIDGLHILEGSESPINGGDCPWGYMLISTTGPGKVPNHSGGTLKFSGEDVLGFCATSLGDNTAGKWHKVLDGSDQGMPKNSTDSISLSADGNVLYLTTKGTFNVDTATGGHSMVYGYDLVNEEFFGPLFVAADEGLTQKVDGLQYDVAP